MTGKSIGMHLGWAAVAAGAFVLGMVGPAGQGLDGEDGATVAGAPDPAGAGSSGPRAGERDSDRPGPKASDRDAREAGGLASVFDSFSAAGGLNGLATEALRDANPVKRRLAFARLLEAMTPENADEIRGHLLELGADGAEWRDFHYSWGAIAGKDAFDFAGESEERDLGATMAGWAAARPEEAMAMFESLPEELAGQRDQLAERMVEGLADHDPAMATDFVLRLAADGTGDADDMIRMVGHEILRGGDVSEASRWSESLPPGELRSAAMDRVAEDFVRRDPEAAAAWVEALAGEDDSARAVAEIGGEWAKQDPVTAVGWLERLPAGRGQEAGLNSAFGDWEDRDPAKASEYLMAMEPSSQRDAAVSGFSRGYAWQDPEVAIAWAEDISDPGLRLETLKRAGHAYVRRDPESARAWLETSGLPESAREDIRNRRR